MGVHDELRDVRTWLQHKWHARNSAAADSAAQGLLMHDLRTAPVEEWKPHTESKGPEQPAPQSLSSYPANYLDEVMVAAPSQKPADMPEESLHLRVVATHDDLARLQLQWKHEVRSCLIQAVTAAEKAAAKSAEEQMHQLVHGMESYPSVATRSGNSMDAGQRAGIGMLRTVADCRNTELPEPVEPLQDAVDRLATSHGQLLEAVADQVQRVNNLELHLTASTPSLPSDGSCSVDIMGQEGSVYTARISKHQSL